MWARLQLWRQAASDQLDAWALRVRGWDHQCLDFICRQPRLRRVSKLFVVATYCGDGYLWLLVGLGIIGWGTSLDRRRVAVMFVITCLNIALFRLSKQLTKRDRPDSPAALELRFRYLDSYSFPSGHATTSFGLAYMLSAFYPFWPAQTGAYLAAFVIAFSRVYVGEHYPSDVISGALLGVLAAKLLLPLVGALFIP